MIKKITISKLFMKNYISRVISMLFPVLLFPFLMMAQKTFSGHIRSSVDKQPISGASIIVRGLHIGTTTNVEGYFSTKAKQGDVVQISGASMFLHSLH